MTAAMRAWIDSDAALTTLDEALAGASADHVEVFVAARTGSHVRFAGERVHQPQTIIECQVMVRAVAAACELARRRDGRPGAAVPHGVAGPAASRAAAPAGTARSAGPVRPEPAALWHDAAASWDAGVRSALAGRLMTRAARAGGIATGVLTAAVTELAVATTAGLRRYAAATEAGFSLTARSGEASSYAADLGRDVAGLRVEDRADAAIEQAARTGPVIAVPDGVHDVVFGGLATGELIGFLPAFGFTGPAVAAGIGLPATRAGELVAAPDVTVADDALSGAGLPFPFDFEGTPKSRVELITAGRVGAPVSDLASAAATGGVSTGHAHIARESSPAPEAANLMMTPGNAAETELIAGVEHGLYVQRLWYNRLVDAEAGTIVGTSRDGCFLIENGKVTTGLATGRFTESVVQALARTDGVGAELITQPVPNVWNGCVSAPAIRVRGFRFGSRPGTD